MVVKKHCKKTLSLRTQRRPYHWGPWRESFQWETWRWPLSLWNIMTNAINGDPQELQNPQWRFPRKLSLFGFLVIVYDREDDRDKFSKKNRGFRRLRFHTTSHLKVSPVLAQGSLIVSVCMVYLQGMYHEFQINVINAFYNKFWNQFGKLFKRSLFFTFDIWKKRRQYAFNLLFLVSNI